MLLLPDSCMFKYSLIMITRNINKLLDRNSDIMVNYFNSVHLKIKGSLLHTRGTLVAPSLGISLLLKGGGTDPLRN